MDLTLLARTLEATLSPDTRTIQDAQISLEQAAKEDLVSCDHSIGICVIIVLAGIVPICFGGCTG